MAKLRRNTKIKKKAAKEIHTNKRSTSSKRQKPRKAAKKKVSKTAGTSNSSAKGKRPARTVADDLVEQPSNEPSVVQHVIVLVVDTAARQPIKNIKAQLFDVTDKRSPINLGDYVTNPRGVFVFPLIFRDESHETTAAKITVSRQVSVTLFDRDDTELHHADFSVSPEVTKRIEIVVPAPKAPILPSETLAEVNKQLKLNISTKTLAELAKRGITTLANLRGTDLLEKKLVDTIQLDYETRNTLAAHANLELLTANTKQRVALVEKGYRSSVAIANTPRHVFLPSMTNSLDVADAVQLYLKAEAQTAVLKNLLTGLRVNAANTAAQFRRARADVQTGDKIEECPLSESALSPTAYFADLVDYTRKHLESTDPQYPTLTLDILGDLFHQPFAELPISSRWVNREVRQVRIAVEVLRGYVREQNPINQPGLKVAERRYRRLAYETLLQNIATSYEEMQLFPSTDQETRKEIAERLGIDPTHLDELAAGAKSAPVLTEHYLDRLFGLSDTLHDPLSTGAKSDDAHGRVIRWIIEGVSWNRNTDIDGTIWGTYRTVGKLLHVRLYRDQARTQIIASGESPRKLHTKVIVQAADGSGVSGRIDIMAPLPLVSGDFSVAVVPRFLAWRFANSRQLWLRQDWLEEPYNLDVYPVIDPDLIYEVDLRKPEVGQPAFDLWQERRHQLDDLLADLNEARSQGFKGALELVWGDPLPPLDTLMKNLRDGTTIESTISQIENLNLTVESFTRLMEVKAKDDAQDDVTDEDWEEAIAILAQAEKTKKFPEWQAKESTEMVILGPKDFWLALDEPQLPKWLASQDARQAWKQTLAARSRPPNIDPDVVAETELVNRFEDPQHGSVARRLWTERNDWISSTRQKLEDNYSNDLVGLLEDIVGVTPYQWEYLAKQREAGDSIGDRLNQLDLSFDAYEYLLHIDQLLKNNVTVPPEDWTNVYDIVFRVQKQREIGEWRIAEKIEHITLSPDFFMPARKTTEDLPPWRASWSHRRDWEDQLYSRMAQDQSLIEGQLEAVGAAEEAALPILRDELVTATSLKWGSLGTGVGHFNNCFDLAFGIDGYIYVTDRLNHRIQLIDDNGRFVLAWGEKGSGEGQFNYPSGVAVDMDVYVYVTDENSRIQKFNSDGQFVMSWGSSGSGDGQFKHPRGVVVDAKGFVYVADTYNHRIQKFDTSGAFKRSWGSEGGGNGQFRYPGRMAIDGESNVYVADMYNHRIQKFDADGNFLAKWGSKGSGDAQFVNPGGVAVDSEGNVYIADSLNHRIQKFDADGNFLAKWGSKGSGDAQYHQPSSVVCANVGSVYVADTMNHRLQKVCADHVAEKKKWLTQNLLIDTNTAACQTTTRPAHAITTFQALVRATTQRQLETGSLTFPHAEHFDEEWTWIGSYGNWRAAMFVFGFPENVLYPSLIDRKTLHLESIISDLYTVARLDAERASALSKEYLDYFRDVSNLSIQANCIIYGPIPTPICGIQQEDKEYVYVFGLAHGRIYWSSYDREAEPDFAQTFWTRIHDLDNVLEIAGAVPDNRTRTILLIVKIRSNQSLELALLKYDLNTRLWGSKTSLSLDIGDSFDVAVSQGWPSGTGYNPFPKIIISYDGSANNAEAKIGTLNLETSNWEDELTPLDLTGSGLRRIQAVIYCHSDAILVVGSSGYVGQGTLKIGNFQKENDNWILQETWVEIDPGYPKQWLGAVNFRATGSIPQKYILWRLQSPGSPVFVAKVMRSWNYAPTVDEAEEIGTQFDTMANAFWPSWGGGLGMPIVFGRDTYVTRGWHRAHISATSYGATPTIDDEGLAAPRELLESEYTTVEGDPLPTITIEHTDPEGGTWLEILLDPDPYAIGVCLSSAQLQARREYARKLRSVLVGPKSNHVYIDEAYYFLSIQLAMRLHRNKQYTSALDWFRTVYDYTVPIAARGLSIEDADRTDYSRGQEWYRYPLNPHVIAAMRPGAYSRFTILTLVWCLLDYAEVEYTRDTSESLPRARELYETALALLDVQDFHPLPTSESEGLIRLGSLRAQPYETLGESLGRRKAARERMLMVLASQTTVQQLIESTGARVGRLSRQALSQVTADAMLSVEDRAPDLTADVESYSDQVVDMMEDPLHILPSATDTVEREAFLTEVEPTAGREMFSSQMSTAISSLSRFGKVPIEQYDFCIPENPLLSTLRLRGEINLHKLRSCRNIAGMVRQVESYSTALELEEMSPVLAAVFRAASGMLSGAITIRPTQYRYQALISRAKELANIAQQMEAAMLSALQNRNLSAYNELKAKQDVQVVRTGVQLQDLRIASAENGVNLAEMQETRAQIQVNTYETWIKDGLNEWERSMISSYQTAGNARVFGAFFDSIVAASQIVNPYAAPAAAVALTGRYMSTVIATAAETQAQVASVWASFERRKQEWELQKALAQQDVAIGGQQVLLAQDQVRITSQERNIAGMQADHAETIANFLSNQFLNADLYDWMSGILEGVYSFFLQQATAVARLAENQLAFERQEPSAAIVQPDYWAPLSEEQVGTGDEGQDRRGLTGSARLLRDIYQLDQYRFDTETRKLQLTKTISLSQLAPAELQRFRETGIVTFATPMELFDRDFPGHYLRLIKRVRTSVLALIPPTAGIHATLTTPGVSRVVVGGYTFEEITVRRDPESVALTSPQNASGLFELTPESDMLLPFEGNGVDSLWDFRMPKAANQFNYQTIADVLLTIEYTALDSDIYRQQVLAQMDRRMLLDRGFSFQQQFPDQWYHLNNPENDTDPVTVSFSTDRSTFPPNVDRLRIEHLLLYFTREDEDEVDVEYLYFFDQEGGPPLGGSARTVDGRISTRSGNASSWLAITGRPPLGRWELTLPANTVKRIKEGDIGDILFVISYSGQVPAWPQ